VKGATRSFEIGEHISGGLVSKCAILVKSLDDEPIKIRRDRRIDR
jgi:hypothetical protein